MNFYKRYMGDYARKTAHLTLAQRGAYDALLDHYYSTRRSLPADLESLCRICNAQGKAETEAVSGIIEEFFPLNGDGTRHNKRADEEIRRWNVQASVNKEIGKLGGRPKKTESVISENRIGFDLETESVVEVRSQKLEVTCQKPETKRKGRRETETVELPDWIPIEHWTSFLAMRTKIRKPATARAQRMLIGKLSELKDQGYNPMQVIAQAELNCWKSFFPPKDKQ